jgi:phage terminase large subunit-like protein
MLPITPGTLPPLDQIQAERCKRSLHYYVKWAWPLVEPETIFRDNWHVGLICANLEAVTALQFQNLIINIPPRHLKSLIVSVFWPTWVWLKHPATKWLTASHGLDLAIRDAVRSRRIIQSPAYQANFGDVFQLAGDQNVKSRYENTRSGYRISLSVGQGTGEGADYMSIDDPLKADDADSDALREGANTWLDNTMSTRANDQKTVRRVLIMQRLHENDATGYTMAKALENTGASQWEHLVLPARYEPKRYYSSINLKDPRTQPGELLDPVRFDDASLKQIEADLGIRGTAGQLQQRPAPDGGNIYLEAHWQDGKNRYDWNEEAIRQIVIARWISFDTALKDEETNDDTAMVVWELLADYRLIIRHAWWRKLQFPQLCSAINEEAQYWNIDKKLRGILIEDKASGTSALQTLGQQMDETLRPLLLPFLPTTSKTARHRQASLWCERDCILLPFPSVEVPWLFDFEQALYKVPASKLKDVLDAWSQGIIYLENLISEGWRARAAHNLAKAQKTNGNN